MSFPTRSLSSSHVRQSSVGLGGGNSAALAARVEEKKAELENLRELRDLSAAIAEQMAALEGKLGTLSEGTEAIAQVMSNWHNVLRAINMASTKIPRLKLQPDDEPNTLAEVALPQTLVRIPTEHAPALQAQAESAAEGLAECD